MVEVEIVEPNITREENEKNLQIVKEILTKIARDMRRNGRTLKSIN